jgi:hypothetical protein
MFGFFVFSWWPRGGTVLLRRLVLHAGAVLLVGMLLLRLDMEVEIFATGDFLYCGRKFDLF